MARILTMEEVLELQATARTRGDYKDKLGEFATSGDLAWDFSDLFPGKEAEAIRNSVNQNWQKYARESNWPKIRVMIDRKDENNHHCVVLNMDLLGSQNGNQPDEIVEEPTTEETA